MKKRGKIVQKRKNKKAISKILTIIFLILLVLVLIAGLWSLLKNLIKEQGEIAEAKTELINVDLDIDNADILDGILELSITRGAGRTILKDVIVEGKEPADIFSVIDVSNSMRNCIYEKKDYCKYSCEVSPPGCIYEWRSCYCREDPCGCSGNYCGSVCSFGDTANNQIYLDNNEKTICKYQCMRCYMLPRDVTKECEYTGGDCSGDYCNFDCLNTANNNIYPKDVCAKTMLDVSKAANKNFIIAVLTYSEDNQVGLIAYNTGVVENYFHGLSNNEEDLKNKIDDWIKADGQTCICCGINRAINELGSDSQDRRKAIVVMSDGVANVGCDGNAIQDAINAAKEANNKNNNIIVHTIGFGEEVDAPLLQEIAEAGGGEYYYTSDVNKLAEIYEVIAEQIEEKERYDHLKIILYSETGSCEKRIPYPPDYPELPAPLETREYSIKIKEVGCEMEETDIRKIEIYLAVYTESGIQVIGPRLDSWKIGYT